MSDLKAKKRDVNAKGKQLRREGIIPAVLFGKHLKESLNIQIAKGDAEQFLKRNGIGSKLELVVGRKKHMALLKEVTYIPVISSIEHISFQALTAGEKVASTARIHLLNKDKVDGILQQTLSEISYTAFPADLIDIIEVDLTGMVIGDNIKVSDLDFVKNDKLDIHSDFDDIVVSIAAPKEFVEETDAEAEATEEDVDIAEVPLVEEKKPEAE